MPELPVPRGEAWSALAGGTKLPEHEIMRIKTYLHGAGQDDLVYTEWHGQDLTRGYFDDGDVVDRLVIVGEDGAGRRLRRRDFRFEPDALLEDVASIYLCKGKTADSDAELRYVFVDCQTGDGKPILVCLRPEFIAVSRLLGLGGGTTGSAWKGSQPLAGEEWSKLDESAYLFPDDLLSSVIDNTSLFLKGELAALLFKWQVPPKRGVLLHGKPGNGKTVLSRIAAKRAIAAGVNVVFLDVDSLREDDRRRRYGEYMTATGVAGQFRLAASRAPVLIIIDDIDVHCGHRSAVGDQGESEQRQRFLADLLEFLDGVERLEGFAMLATTNSIDALDPALLRAGRLDVHISVPGPDIDQRKVVLRQALAGEPKGRVPDVTQATMAMEGCSFADVVELAKRYKLSIVGQYGAVTVDQQLLDQVAEDLARELGLAS